MTPYLAMFVLPALMALAGAPVMRLRRDGTRVLRVDALWVIVFLCIAALVGFRFEVGGDWRNYLVHLQRAELMGFGDIPLSDDPAYWFINILSQQLGLGVTGVNFIGAILFSTGLVVFCRSTPRPWVALACAIPYLVIVVAMGYTRQGIAIGLVMIGLVAFVRRQTLWFVVWVLLGALFHKSAVILLPLAALALSQRRGLSLSLIAVSFGLGYFLLLRDSVEHWVAIYVDENIASAGALIRLAMNAVPAALFLIYRKKFIISDTERRFYGVLSLLSLGLFTAFFVTNLSTALDRLALYIIPLQLLVFAHLPDALGRPGGRNQVIVFCIMLYYLAVLLVWLITGTHARYWLPYRIGIA